MKFQDFKDKYEHISVKQIDNNVLDNPMVSICVITYQHKNYIAKCLDGILMQQTDFSFEVLLGEDASNDGTREICLNYAEKNRNKIRLFLHHRENNIYFAGSPSAKFNLIYNLHKARGKYIALCEGDDYWTDPLKLQKQVDVLESKKSVAMCTHETNHLFYPLDRNRSLKRMLSILYRDTQLYGIKRLFELSELLLFNKDKFWLQDRSHLHKKRKEFIDLQAMSDGTWFMSFCSILMRRELLEPMPDCLLSTGGAHQTLLLWGAMNGGIIHLTESMGVKRDQETSISKNKDRKEKIKLANKNIENHNRIKRFKCLQQYGNEDQRELLERMVQDLLRRVDSKSS